MFQGKCAFADGDYSERAMVANILVGHVFNPAARCNIPGAKAFREFVRLASGLDVTSVSEDEFWTGIEYRVNRTVFTFDQTELDAMFTVGDRMLGVIECKYCDFFKLDTAQFDRVAKAARELGAKGGMKHSAMVLIAPEQEFASIVKDKGRADVKTAIDGLIKVGDPPLRMVSWEMVFALIGACSPEDKPLLENYIKTRNCNRVYRIRFGSAPKVATPGDWESIFCGREPVPAGIRVPKGWASADRASHSTAEADDVLGKVDPWQKELYDVVLQMAKRESGGNLAAYGRKKGQYIKIQRQSGNGQNDLLIYPSAGGLALIYDEQKCTRSGPDGKPIAFKDWEHRAVLKRVHKWFRDRESVLRVWVIKECDWHQQQTRFVLDSFVREIVQNRDKTR